MIVKYPFFPIERCQVNILPTFKFSKIMQKVLSQDINKLEGFFSFLYVCVCLFLLNNSFLFATTVTSSVNLAPQHSIFQQFLNWECIKS